MRNYFKRGIRILSVMVCMMLVWAMAPAAAFAAGAGEPAYTAENLFVQMEADGVYQQYVDLMETSVRYQDEKEVVWDAIHTAVELQRQALKDGTETLMPEDMAKYMNSNGLDYDMTGGDLYQSAEQWDVAVNSLYARLNILQSELNLVLTEANGIASMYNAGISAGGMSQIRGGGLFSGGGMGKLIVGVLIGILLGSGGATAAGRSKKRMGV